MHIITESRGPILSRQGFDQTPREAPNALIRTPGASCGLTQSIGSLQQGRSHARGTTAWEKGGIR